MRSSKGTAPNYGDADENVADDGQFYGVRSYLDNFYDIQKHKKYPYGGVKPPVESAQFSEDASPESPVWEPRRDSNFEKRALLGVPSTIHQTYDNGKGGYMAGNVKIDQSESPTPQKRGSKCAQFLRNAMRYMIFRPIGFRASLILGCILMATGLALSIYGFFVAKQMPVVIRPDDIPTNDPSGIQAAKAIEAQIDYYLKSHLPPKSATPSNVQNSQRNGNNSSAVAGNSYQPSELERLYAEDKLRKNILVVDKYAIAHNRVLKWIKMGGLFTFFGSALALCLCILFSLFYQHEDYSLPYATSIRRRKARRVRAEKGGAKVKRQNRAHDANHEVAGEMIEVENLSSGSGLDDESNAEDGSSCYESTDNTLDYPSHHANRALSTEDSSLIQSSRHQHPHRHQPEDAMINHQYQSSTLGGPDQTSVTLDEVNLEDEASPKYLRADGSFRPSILTDELIERPRLGSNSNIGTRYPVVSTPNVVRADNTTGDQAQNDLHRQFLMGGDQSSNIPAPSPLQTTPQQPTYTQTENIYQEI